MKPFCRYCKHDIHLYHIGDAEYPYQKDYGPVWKCVPCDAYVGCHKGTERPLGLVADAATRAAKIKAHAAFDPLWMRKMRKEGISKSAARGAAHRGTGIRKECVWLNPACARALAQENAQRTLFAEAV